MAWYDHVGISAYREESHGKNRQRQTYDIPEAGRLAGLGRGASYQAARRGEMPVITLGKRKLVPKEAWDRRLRGRRPAAEA